MKIRKAIVRDLNGIMLMYKSCVNGMLNNGIEQWDKKYPNANVILEDLKAMTYYVIEIDSSIVGGINIDKNQDKTYLEIDWKDNSDSFLVVHRLAVKENLFGIITFL